MRLLLRRLLFLLAAIPLLTGVVHGITVEPSELRFETRLDETPLLMLEVNLETALPSALTVQVEGVKCDHRVLAKGNGHFTVEIAPDTSVAGNSEGNIVLKCDGKAVGPAIPVAGVVRSWVTAQPSKLFIGSIGHGATYTEPQTYSATLSSDNDAFDVESVDFQGIEGASWRCEPPAGVSAQWRKLKFVFSPDAVAAQVPYGALAKKVILVHLSHPKASTVVIPVLGLVSINTTGRDYSQYLYQGHLRWSGTWSTPNIAAAFLATGIVFLGGIAAALDHLLARRLVWRVALGALVAPTLTVGSYLLAETYSRGGWCAAAVGIGILFFSARFRRLYPIGLAILSAVAIALHPSGLSRAASTTQVTEDKSVHHRLLVWQGALQMMMEHPWRGVGSGQFGNVFKSDYQLPTHTQEYTTAINDFLTLGAERGLVALVLASSFALSLIVIAIFAGAKKGTIFLIGCAAALACHLVSCWFSSIGFQWNPSFLALAAAVGIIIALAWHQWRHPQGWRWIARCSLLGLTLAAIIGSTIVIMGLSALARRPVTSRLSIGGVKGLEIHPRWGKPHGTIIYIAEETDAEALLKSTLRPLAQKGWTVLELNESPSSPDAVATMLSDLQRLQSSGRLKAPWFIAGHRKGAQAALALAAASHPQAVACYLSPSHSAFADLSPCDILPKLSIPVLLAAQDADPLRSYIHLAELTRASQSAANKPKVAVDHGDFSLESPSWQKWIAAIDSFCRAPN